MESTTTTTSDLVPEDTGSVPINGWPIHYDRYGTGSQIILMIPGAIGTARSDFFKQLTGPYALNRTKYTIIVVELPGWGRSRPPRRPFGKDLFDNDVECVSKLMKHLNYCNYSIVGWSDGAKVAILTTIRNPNSVQSVVAIGLAVYCHRFSLLSLIKSQNIALWNPDMLQNYRQVYGDELQSLWDDYINFVKDFQSRIVASIEANPEKKESRFAIHDQLMNGLSNIRCPTMLIQGDKDPLVRLEQTEYCNERIANCVVHRFPEGSHNLHQTEPDKFCKIVEQFLNDAYGDFF